ncbi:MAG: helix-turn-helix domain-containing protein [Clostridia bacterium]|nr:helix-turn-helix domain-containing protein [Clostridia bacterium]MBQ4611188.1 helix-turn-helix domain-containing protein [Clostridia bacterium]
MPYVPVELRPSLQVDRLYTVHYFEYTSNYSFAGESHDFWEFLYVDKGSIRAVADDAQYDLSRGQILFHAPGEFHGLSANGVTAPNLVVVSFECRAEAMEFFRGYMGSLGAEERSLLSRIVSESRSLFSTPLNDPTTHSMELGGCAPFGSAQLLAAAIEELLIRLIRRGSGAPAKRPAPRTSRTEGIIAYLEQRLDQTLTIDQICRDNLIGRAKLESLFSAETGGGVLDHFSRMKMDAARGLIREGRLNISEISSMLGFSSVHYFSRRFKKLTGMTPTEYARSVKMLMESPEQV